MNEARALEIIAAYGGDPARWPDGEREAAWMLVARSAPLARARDEAMRLDALIDDWAKDNVVIGGGSDAAADAVLAHVLAEVSTSRRPRWLPAAMVGGSLAAAVAAGVLLVQPSQTQAPMTVAATEQIAQASADAHVWGKVFTPTPEEESLI